MSPCPNPQSLQASVDATDIDLRCALAFSRSAMRTLAVLSKSAHAELDRCLGEEIDAVAFDDGPGRSAVEAIIEEARASLAERRHEVERIRRLEEALTEEARRLGTASSL